MSRLRAALVLLLRLPWWLRALTPLAIAAMLWFLSAQQPRATRPDPLFSWLHNSAHIVAYAALAAAIYASAAATDWLGRRGWQATSVALAAAYGVVDEWHQSFVPGRVCSLLDVLSDLVGAVAGVFLLRAIWEPASWSWRHCGLLVVAALLSTSLATWLPW